MLKEKANSCTKCEELVKNRKQVVFGEGDNNAKILLCSEAPGFTEDELGRPFVGMAGELLDNIIKACGWKRENLFITNTCLCRPPNNRTPTDIEANNCKPFLKLQIKAVNPKYIICFGLTAAKNLLNTNAYMSQLRGKWHKYVDDYVNSDVIVTYHPSYALRVGEETKQQIWEDLLPLLEKL